MAVLPIRVVPDPVLHQESISVDQFDDELQRFAQDMLATMYEATGRGLAAPQVGLLCRMFVMDATWKEGPPSPMTFVNPEIVDVSPTLASLQEGCLSIPDQTVEVARPDWVQLCWQDISGEPQEARFEGFAAACVQHEIDHLNGVLITDDRS